jgi:hypothetical protein
MKKKIGFVCWGILFLGLMSGCTQKLPELSTEEVTELLANISESPLELKITADPSGISIEQGLKKSQYQITLTDPEVRFSTAIYKHMNLDLPEVEVPLVMKQLVMLYRPSEKNLKLKSAQDIKCDLVLSELLADLDPPGMTIHYQLDRAVFEGYDISSLIEAQDKSFQDVLTGFVSSNNKMNMNAQGFSMKFSGRGKQAETIDFSLKSMETSFQAEPGLVMAFLKNEGVDEIVSGLLGKKVAAVDLKAVFEGMDFELDSAKEKIKAGFQKGGFSYSLVPSQNKDVFDFKSEWSMEGLNTEGMPEQIEIFSRLNEMTFEFSVYSLSPGFMRAYFDLVKTAQSMNRAREAETQQEMMKKGPALAGEFIKTKPMVKVSISPLDHYLGKIEAYGEFQFIQMGPPIGKAEAIIQDISKMEQNIRQAFPPQRAQAFLKWIKQIFRVDDNGQGKMVFELKKQDPEYFYLNGEKHPFNQGS